jgi:uncharacterized membrane protein YbhN (UPF0104 family)
MKKKMIFLGLKAVLSVLILMFLLNRIRLEEVTGALASAALSPLIAAVLLLALNLYLQFAKWRLLVLSETAGASAKEIFFSLLAGITLGLATPGRMGEYGRPFFLKRAHWARLLGLTVIDKLYTFSIILFTGSLGLCCTAAKPVWLAIVPFTALFLLVLVLRPDRFGGLLKKYRASPRLGEFVSALSGFSRANARKLSFLALLYVLTFMTQFYLLVRAFIPINPVQGMCASSATLLTKTLLPLTIGDLGIREGAAVFFFGRFQVPAAAAFDASLLLFVINVLAPGLAGLITLLRSRASAIRALG